MDLVKLEPGTEYKADGENIPAYVTYEGLSGQEHHYVPVEMVEDYLDIPVSWSNTRNSLVLGPTSEGVEYQILTGEERNQAVRDTPELGAKAGPFTEIDPKTVDTSEGPQLIIEDETRVQSWTGFGTELPANTMHGEHILLAITNNGEEPLTSAAGRARRTTGYDFLSRVKIEPGQTLTRAFLIDEAANDRIHNLFAAAVYSYNGARQTDLTVTLMQYK